MPGSAFCKNFVSRVFNRRDREGFAKNASGWKVELASGAGNPDEPQSTPDAVRRLNSPRELKSHGGEKIPPPGDAKSSSNRYGPATD